MPNNSMHLNREKDWVKKIEQYIKFEKKARAGKLKSGERPINWIPGPSETCYSKGDETIKNKNCKSGLDDYFNFGNIDHKMVYGTNIKQILEEQAVVS